MLKVPLKITYAVLATLDLAIHYGSTPIQAKVIARRQSIPIRFIEQILHALKQAGIIESVRGAQGGYSLQREPSQITLAHIVEAMNGPLDQPVGSNGNNGHTEFSPHHEALLSSIWDQVRQAELGVLSSYTLDTLAERYEKFEQEHTLMYHI